METTTKFLQFLGNASTQELLVLAILALSVVSTILYILPNLIFKDEQDGGDSRKKTDSFVRPILTIMLIAISVMTSIYFYMEFFPK